MASHADADHIFESVKARIKHLAREDLVKHVIPHHNHDTKRVYQISFMDYTRLTGVLELTIDRAKIQIYINQASGEKFNKIKHDLSLWINKHNTNRWEGIRGHVGHAQ